MNDSVMFATQPTYIQRLAVILVVFFHPPLTLSRLYQLAGLTKQFPVSDGIIGRYLSFALLRISLYPSSSGLSYNFRMFFLVLIRKFSSLVMISVIPDSVILLDCFWIA